MPSTPEVGFSNLTVNPLNLPARWQPHRVAALQYWLERRAELGLSYARISNYLGVSPSMLRHAAQKLGLIRPSPSRTWTPERQAELEQLFDAQLTAAEIGRRMGLSKNAIIGRLHRQAMTRGGKPFVPTPNLFPSIGSCLWPYSSPGDAEFHFCGTPAIWGPEGRTWCAAHRRRIYRRILIDESGRDVRLM